MAPLGVLPVDTYSLNFANFGPGVTRVMPRGDMHQSFTDARVEYSVKNEAILTIVGTQNAKKI